MAWFDRTDRTDGAATSMSTSLNSSLDEMTPSGTGLRRLWSAGSAISWSNRIRVPSSRRLTYTEKLTMSPLAKFRK